jgi:hypothetical protein
MESTLQFRFVDLTCFFVNTPGFMTILEIPVVESGYTTGIIV